MTNTNHSVAGGLAGASAAVGAYFLWGISSLYWHRLASVPPEELLGYRVLVSCLMLVLMLVARGSVGATCRAACSWRSLSIYSGSAVSIATNWSVFMWASIHGHVVETGIGYLIAPLVNVAFGACILGERLSAARRGAVAVLVLGLVLLIVRAGELTIWIYLAIGISFGFYSLFRKLGPLGAVQGLAVETSLLSVPVAVAWVFGWISLGHPLIASPEQSVTLMLCGIVSVVPLWLFSFANRSLPLATLGFFQYTLPTTQFALAILYYRQIPSVSTFISLGIIWAALGLVVFESVFVGRRPVTVAT